MRKTLPVLAVFALSLLIPSSAFSDNETFTQAIANAKTHADHPSSWVATDASMVKVSEAGSVGANPYGLTYYGAAANNQLIVRTLSKSINYDGVRGTATAGANYVAFGSTTSMSNWVTTGKSATDFIDNTAHLTADTITTGMERGLGMNADGSHDAIFEMAVTVGNSGNNIHLLRPVRDPDPTYYSTNAADYGTSGNIPADAKAAGLCTAEPNAAADSVYANFQTAYTNWASSSATTFPWTQLGYTYYYGQVPNPPTDISQIQGMSEFILLGGTGDVASKSPSGTDETGKLVTVGIYATQSYIYTKNNGQYGNGYANFDVTADCNTLWAGKNFQAGASLNSATLNTITIEANSNVSGGEGILVGSRNYTVTNLGTITCNSDTKKFNTTGSENIALLFKGDAAAYVGAVKNTLINSGVIVGPGANGTAVKVLAGDTAITNTGAIYGSGSGYAIQTADGDDLVRVNGGTVEGNIDLGTGTDTLDIINGGTVTGNITTGGGGSVTMNGGTLNMTGGAIAVNGITGGANNDTVAISGGTVTGGIDLAGGSNTLNAGSDSTFSAALVVDGEIFATGGTLDITVNGTGSLKAKDMLGSNGDITARNVDLNYGRLEAESAYTQAAGSTLKTSISDGSQYGNIKANSATLGAYNMQVTVASGNLIRSGQTFKIIDAGAGQAANVTKPTTITDNSYALNFAASNGAGGDLYDLILTASRENLYNTAGESANASAVGAVFDSLAQAGATGDMATVLSELDTLPDAASVEGALATITPVVDSGVTNVSNTTINQFIGTTTDRLGGLFAQAHNEETGVSTGSKESSGFEAWGRGFGEAAHQDPRGTSNGYSATIWGTALGGDIPAFYDKVRFGASGGYASSNVNSKDNSGRTCINSYQSTFYGGYIDPGKPYYINGAFSFAYNTYRGKRNIDIGTIRRIANSSYRGQQYSVLFDGGYIFRTRNLNITPVASLQYLRLNLQSYTETGADALDLSVASQGYNMLESGLGMKLDRPFEVSYGTLTPEVHLRWLYDFINDKQATASTFAGGGGSFATQGFTPARNALNVGGRMALVTKGNWSFDANYDFEYKQDFTSHTGWADIRYKF